MRGRFLVILCGLVAGFPFLPGAEYGGRWDRESKADRSWRLIEYLRLEQMERLEQLDLVDPAASPILSFSNFPEEQEAQGKRLHEKFLAGRLSEKSASSYLNGIYENLQANQDLLYEAEKEALVKWKKEEGISPESLKKSTAKILGRDVTAIRLGVILDSSPSMREVVGQLREEIAGRFAYSYFMEVDGSWIEPDPHPIVMLTRPVTVSSYQGSACPWFFADPPKYMNPFQEHWHSPRDLSCLKRQESCFLQWPSMRRHSTSALLAMTDLLELDTIFWFSDFRDSVDERFTKALLRKFRENEIRLYLVSNARSPHELLQLYAKQSGGEYRKERVR